LPVAVLHVTSADIINRQITRHVVERVRLLDALAGLAEDDAEFTLIIDLLGSARQPDRR
jgi:hypothetical protein